MDNVTIFFVNMLVSPSRRSDRPIGPSWRTLRSSTMMNLQIRFENLDNQSYGVIVTRATIKHYWTSEIAETHTWPITFQITITQSPNHTGSWRNYSINCHQRDVTITKAPHVPVWWRIPLQIIGDQLFTCPFNIITRTCHRLHALHKRINPPSFQNDVSTYSQRW